MRVLLAEDDPQLAARLTADLRRHGYAVDVASDGIDAEHQGNEIAYDAVILDLGLPGQPGLEVLRKWRSRNNSVPVLILTSRDAWHQKVDGFEAGADDYLGKPFHVEELCARLGALLRRRHAQVSGTVCASNLVLDEARQTVSYDGKDVALSGVEFRLLRCFMLRPGELLSKTELAAHIYDEGADHDSNVIEVYISHLRNKIGTTRIRTRRGQGYVFEPDL